MISNAVCHRSYISPGAIQVAIYDDRLEVTSPGRISQDLTIEQMIAGNSRIQNKAREPLSKMLEDGIFEIRTIEGNDIVRVLYFFDNDRIIIATNGFVKKKQKTPRNEIELAKKRRADYHQRMEAGTYE